CRKIRNHFVHRDFAGKSRRAQRCRHLAGCNPAFFIDRKPESLFLKMVWTGSTGDAPVPSGDSPDGTGTTVRANRRRLFATLLAAVPVGGSRTGAGGSPAPPIFETVPDLRQALRGGRIF